MTRCLLLQSGLDSSFWSVSVATACHIRNRCPTSTLNWKTPFEKIFNRKPYLQYLRTFGSKVIILDKNPTKSKLSPRGVEGILVGYPKDRKGYRVWIPNERKMLFSRDVKILNESCKSINLSNAQNFLIDSDAIKNNKKYIEFYEKTSSEIENIENNEQNIQCNEYPEFFEETSSENENIENNVQNIQSNEYPEENHHDKECVCRGPGKPKILRTGERGRPRKEYCSTNVNNTKTGMQEMDLNEETEILQNPNQERQ